MLKYCLLEVVRDYGFKNVLILVIHSAAKFEGLGTHLFIKVPWPEDSEVTFSVF